MQRIENNMGNKKDDEHFLRLYNKMRLKNIQQFLDNVLDINNIDEQLNLDFFNEEKDISELTTEDGPNRNSSREVKENKQIQSIIHSLSEEKFFNYSHLAQILPFHHCSSPPKVFSQAGKKDKYDEKRK